MKWGWEISTFVLLFFHALKKQKMKGVRVAKRKNTTAVNNWFLKFKVLPTFTVLAANWSFKSQVFLNLYGLEKRNLEPRMHAWYGLLFINQKNKNVLSIYEYENVYKEYTCHINLLFRELDKFHSIFFLKFREHTCHILYTPKLDPIHSKDPSKSWTGTISGENNQSHLSWLKTWPDTPIPIRSNILF